MKSITITPKSKKELLALKHFIKALDLTYFELKEDDNVADSQKNDFQKQLNDGFTLEEFSVKTTQFLENLPWKK